MQAEAGKLGRDVQMIDVALTFSEYFEHFLNIFQHFLNIFQHFLNISNIFLIFRTFSDNCCAQERDRCPDLSPGQKAPDRIASYRQLQPQKEQCLQPKVRLQQHVITKRKGIMLHFVWLIATIVHNI